MRFGMMLAGWLLLALMPATAAPTDAHRELAKALATIDAEMQGKLGVYLHHPEQGWSVAHNVDRDWYLASTIKIPLAIVLMQAAEAGELSLEDELVLAESDFVDGSGGLLWEEPGQRFNLGELNRRSIRDSDSTATDMLIRHIGEDKFNERLTKLAGEGVFGPITTILKVRQDAWSEVHPSASNLDNLDFLELNAERDQARRHAMVLDKLGLTAEEVEAGSTREAFHRYYRRGYNSGSLKGFGNLLLQILDGEILDEEHTERLLEIMISVGTGDRRIKAGLSDGLVFAHKTGTQVDRACNVGILQPGEPSQRLIVMACAEDFGSLANAERAFAAIGRLVSSVIEN